ncbi:hypothetical protein FOZ62_014648, partial [Perkinsus olseni]
VKWPEPVSDLPAGGRRSESDLASQARPSSSNAVHRKEMMGSFPIEQLSSELETLPLRARVDELTRSLDHLKSAHSTLQSQVRRKLEQLASETSSSSRGLAGALKQSAVGLRDCERGAMEIRSILEGHISKMEISIARLGRQLEEIADRQQRAEAV